MSDLKEEVIIQKPCEDVFDFLSNIENNTDVLANVVEVNKLTEGPTREGTQFEEIRQFRNRKVGTILEVVKYVPNNKISIKSENNGLVVVYHYSLKKEDETTTKVFFEGYVSATKFLMKIMRPMMVKMLKKEDGEHLVSLKRIIEER
ncbi:SRPBCC family protein [Alteribacter aurantiacus]|uniref:SRPBCC family protein n=1 Tax=Alteribacter aurantiacus TaxID=254410 RepID=UPI000419F921|nr:SRPBCC family protein [Alteribacter aurantiacus]